MQARKLLETILQNKVFKTESSEWNNVLNSYL